MKKFFIYTCLLIFFSSHVDAQKKKGSRTAQQDSLSIVREFMQVCNVYKQLPLHLTLKISNASNFISSADDTSSIDADFYMLPGSSYIRYGEAEQLGNDSMVLLVSSQLQKMILYPATQSLITRMQAQSGLYTRDSSLVELSRKYQSEQSIISHDTSLIELTARANVYNTLIPSEKISLYYNPATKNPYRVATTRRSLMPLEENDYKELLKQGGFSQNLISIDNNTFYLVKEQVSSFSYLQIIHDKNIIMPVSIAERITKKDGEYIPAKGFESFSMIMN